MEAAKGEFLISVDQDVVIRPDTLGRIVDYFEAHPEVAALTGRLAKSHPNLDFWSQYKNLYMHYVFGKLPRSVEFLYGSIHAVRREAALPYDVRIEGTVDTALGQELVARGLKIAFLRDLEVEHLKKHSFRSFVKNDFRIAFEWAFIFIRNRSWRQLGRGKVGFAHARRSQLVSVILALAICLFGLGAVPWIWSGRIAIALAALWFAINVRFFAFLAHERGGGFAAQSAVVTFMDHLVMGSGVLWGSTRYVLSAGRE